MQPDDMYGSSPTGEDVSESRTGTVSGDRQFVSYFSDVGDTVSSGAGRAVEFISEKPLLVGSVVVAIAGAVIGGRIARMIAARRKKTTYDRAMETAGVLAALLGSLGSRESTRKVMDRLADAGKNISGPVQGMRASMAGGVSMPEKPTAARPSTIKQIGYGLSLIPVSLAMIRNPLVRDFGARFLARRVRRK